MTKKMNVLLIISDQHRADHLGCAGNPILKTPNLDKLAHDGIRFTSAYVVHPTCSPNRSSIITGLYPNSHQCRSTGMNLSKNVPTIGEALSNNGYHTIGIGKMHFQFWNQKIVKSARSEESMGHWLSEKWNTRMKDNLSTPYYGFDELEMVIGHGDACTGHYFDWIKEKAPQYIPEIKEKAKSFFLNMYYKSSLPEEFFPTTYVTDRSISFLERYSKGEYGKNPDPFFMFVSYPDPHHPVTPPGKYFDLYKPEDIELPPSYTDIDNVKKHKFLGAMLDNPLFRSMVLRISDEEEVKGFTAATYGSIAMIDDGIGQILKTLERLGLDENTIVIYTSDHGDSMGDHGLILKGPCPYDGILKIPMIWRVPRMKNHGISDSLVSSIDIPQTLLNLLGFKEEDLPPDMLDLMQGVDITPILKNPEEKVRKCCLIEDDEELPHLGTSIRMRHLITDDYKLTVYRGLIGYGDIFDRKNDPNELKNLWYSDPDLRNKLLEQLLHENLKAQSLWPKRSSIG